MQQIPNIIEIVCTFIKRLVSKLLVALDIITRPYMHRSMTVMKRTKSNLFTILFLKLSILITPSSITKNNYTILFFVRYSQIMQN